MQINKGWTVASVGLLAVAGTWAVSHAQDTRREETAAAGEDAEKRACSGATAPRA